MAANENKRILCVGLCCVDIVSVCESFPVEDTDQRSLDYYWQRGGNASNSSTIFALLGADVEFLGTLVRSQEYEFLKSSFSEYGIKTDHCPVYEENDARCPVAVIIVNKQNASRTILAALNNIVELRYEDFEKLPLNEYKWIHFEGRNNAQSIERMIHRVKDFNKSQPEDSHIYMSIELEKVNRTNLIPLAKYTDYVFISKEFAAAQGYHTKEDAVDGFIHQCSASLRQLHQTSHKCSPCARSVSYTSQVPRSKDKASLMGICHQLQHVLLSILHNVDRLRDICFIEYATTNK